MSNTWFAQIFLFVCIVFCAQTNAQDWAQLGHYKKANEELKATVEVENRIVFMGNSITIGWLEHFPEFFKGKNYVNRGIGGQTTPQMLIRFRQDVVALSPSVVVILAGTNDIAGNTGPTTLEMIMDNIKGMAEIAMANNIKVVLASVLPASDYPWKPGCDPHIKIPELNRMIKLYTESHKLVYLDYFSALVNNENGMTEKFAYDGVHPNKEGYLAMAPLTESAIAQALSK
ncbi:MAG: SGNH/GDSL hydrolase family protein [Flavobacteriaceae bacterium]